MKVKIFLYLSILAVFAIGSIAILFSFSRKINYQQNSFIRLFPPHLLEPLNKANLKVNSYYIAGVSDSKIYLGNISSPTYIWSNNNNLSNENLVRINIDKKFKVYDFKSPRTFVNSQNVYLTDGSNGQIIRSKMDSLSFNYNYEDIPRFTLVIPISKSEFILRTYDDRNNRNVLAKYKMYKDGKVSCVNFPSLLKIQQDGIFSTDGILVYDKQSNRIIYLYYYRNEFLNLDTNLNLISTGHTIDTNSIAKITVANLSNNQSSTLASPPLIVNKTCSTDNGKLYIQSGLLSKNEDPNSFKNSTVIDVYSLSDNKYIYSFYLPDFNSYKCKNFQVHNNILFAIYDHYLLTYKFNYENMNRITTK